MFKVLSAYFLCLAAAGSAIEVVVNPRMQVMPPQAAGRRLLEHAGERNGRALEEDVPVDPVSSLSAGLCGRKQTPPGSFYSCTPEKPMCGNLAAKYQLPFFNAIPGFPIFLPAGDEAGQVGNCFSVNEDALNGGIILPAFPDAASGTADTTHLVPEGCSATTLAVTGTMGFPALAMKTYNKSTPLKLKFGDHLEKTFTLEHDCIAEFNASASIEDIEFGGANCDQCGFCDVNILPTGEAFASITVGTEVEVTLEAVDDGGPKTDGWQLSRLVFDLTPVPVCVNGVSAKYLESQGDCTLHIVHPASLWPHWPGHLTARVLWLASRARPQCPPR